MPRYWAAQGARRPGPPVARIERYDVEPSVVGMDELRVLVMDHGGVLTEGPEMAALVRRARVAGVVTALVTDAHVLPDDCVGLFDLAVLGPVLGARKPDPEIYRRVAARLGVRPAQCVVVDDLVTNVRGARAAGAVVVHHRTPGATIEEVEILLGLA